MYTDRISCVNYTGNKLYTGKKIVNNIKNISDNFEKIGQSGSKQTDMCDIFSKEKNSIKDIFIDSFKDTFSAFGIVVLALTASQVFNNCSNKPSTYYKTNLAQNVKPNNVQKAISGKTANFIKYIK